VPTSVLARTAAAAKPPAISSLSPTAVKQGSEETISVKGSGFTPNSFVAVEGFFLKTEYLSATELKGTLVKEVTQLIGTKTVLVHNTDTGTVSKKFRLKVTN
jgi:hypothetical protein